jgi:hypothetical protein
MYCRRRNIPPQRNKIGDVHSFSGYFSWMLAAVPNTYETPDHSVSASRYFSLWFYILFYSGFNKAVTHSCWKCWIADFQCFGNILCVTRNYTIVVNCVNPGLSNISLWWHAIQYPHNAKSTAVQYPPRYNVHAVYYPPRSSIHHGVLSTRCTIHHGVVSTRCISHTVYCPRGGGVISTRCNIRHSNEWGRV